MAHIGGARTGFLMLESVSRRLLGEQRDQYEEDFKKRIEWLSEHASDFMYCCYPPRKIRHFIEAADEIGAGGYGTVFRGRATRRGLERMPVLEEGRSYAVKRTGLFERDPKRQSIMLLPEERLLEFMAAMRSEECRKSHIVRLMAFLLEFPRHMYEVMELLEGSDLFDFLACRKCTLGEALSAQLARQIFGAIHFLHRKAGMIHRDIKPDNFGFVQPIQLDSEGDLPPLKMFDFGVSIVLPKVVEEGTARDLFEMPAAGTLHYMAPECWRRRFGAGVDVWSAGIIVYIMMSLDFPFETASCKGNQEKLKAAITKNPLEFPPDRWEGASGLVQDFIQSALEKDTRRRATTAELLNSGWLSTPGRAPPLHRSTSVPLPTKAEMTGFSVLVSALPAGITVPVEPATD